MMARKAFARPYRRNVAIVVVVVGALLGIATAGNAKTISRPAPISTPSGLAEAWVRAINRTDRRAACELQNVDQVSGLACSMLPEAWNPKCPKMQSLKPRSQSEIRSVTEQVGTITEESPTRAYAQLVAQKRTSKARGALGLELVSGQWRVTFLRQGSETFVPAGNVWDTESWRKLWYPATCSR
jgi:hypothetical protein